MHDFPLTLDSLPYQSEIPLCGLVLFQLPISYCKCGITIQSGRLKSIKGQLSHGLGIWILGPIAVQSRLPTPGGFSPRRECQQRILPISLHESNDFSLIPSILLVFQKPMQRIGRRIPRRRIPRGVFSDQPPRHQQNHGNHTKQTEVLPEITSDHHPLPA